MRIDLDTRLTLATAGGWGVLVGEAIVGILGGPVNTTIVGTAGTILVASLGIGVVSGAKANGRNGAKEKDAR